MFRRKGISTSRGSTWEWLHSLWILWTFALGIFSWVAFFYVAFRTRRVRWFLWGLAYFAVFLAFALSSTEGQVAPYATGLWWSRG